MNKVDLYIVAVVVMVLVIAVEALIIDQLNHKLYNATKEKEPAVPYISADVCKYTQMDFETFDRLLCWTFAQILEQTAFAYESPQDHDAEVELVRKSISKFIEYYASTLSAIEEVYGEGFLLKWTDLKLGILGNRKMIKPLIAQEKNADSLYQVMTMSGPRKK